MTTRTLFRSASLLTVTLLLTALAPAQGTGGDQGAAWEPMFSSSGTIPGTGIVDLYAPQPPVLGQTTHVDLVAPGFDFGFVGISRRATSGMTILLGADPLDIYLDPGLMLGTHPLPLPGGQAQLPLPLPPDPSLSGLELGFQAVVLDPGGNVAASNLLCGNFGIFVGAPALFAFQFGEPSGVNVPRNSYWPSNRRPNAIVDNRTAAAKDYTITGQRSQGGGTLELRDQTGAVVATFGPNTTVISVTLTVPAGTQLYWYNSSGNAGVNGVKWSVAVG